MESSLQPACGRRGLRALVRPEKVAVSRLWVAGAVLLSVLVFALLGIPTPYSVLVPGDAVKIGDGARDRWLGITTVHARQARVLHLLAASFDPNARIVRTVALSGCPDDLTRSKQVATSVALGWVREHSGAAASVKAEDLEVDSVFEGPSAGLMLALAVVDAAMPGQLRGTHRIAGSGRLASDGRIEPVSAIELKVLAAERDGADIFLAPRANAAEAFYAATRLRVIPVDTFDDAMDALQSLGEPG